MFSIDLKILIPLLFGGGGVFALMSLLVKQVTDAKEETIRRLDNEIKFMRDTHASEKSKLEREVDEKEKKIEELLQGMKKLLDEIAEDYESRGLSSFYLRELAKIYDDAIGETRNDAKVAAQFVKAKRNSWLKDIVQHARNECPNELPDSKIRAFTSDMAKYLDWLYDSLYSGFYRSRKDYIQSHAIESIFPYRAALKCLSKIDEFGQLTETEAAFIKNYTYKLYMKISN